MPHILGRTPRGRIISAILNFIVRIVGSGEADPSDSAPAGEVLTPKVRTGNPELDDVLGEETVPTDAGTKGLEIP